MAEGLILDDSKPSTEEELHQLTLELARLPREELNAIRNIIKVPKDADIDVSSLDIGVVNRIKLYIHHAVISWKNIKLVAMDSPRNENLDTYIKICKHYNISHIACVTNPTYSKAKFQEKGIHIHELEFQDGHPPPDFVVSKWLKIVEEAFGEKAKDEEPKAAVGVHCAAGLGRAPVLVAIALIFYGMDKYQAIELIRQKRKGAINQKQLHYLLKYEPKRRCVIS